MLTVLMLRDRSARISLVVSIAGGAAASSVYPSHPGGPDAFDWLVIVGSVLAICAIVFAITIPFARAAGKRAANSTPSLTMRFAVGDTETHSVDIAYTQRGNSWLSVKVDGAEVIGETFVTGFKLHRTAEWQVGTAELHSVRLEKTRLRVYGAQRAQHFVATVDGAVVARGESRLQ